MRIVIAVFLLLLPALGAAQSGNPGAATLGVRSQPSRPAGPPPDVRSLPPPDPRPGIDRTGRPGLPPPWRDFNSRWDGWDTFTPLGSVDPGYGYYSPSYPYPYSYPQTAGQLPYYYPQGYSQQMDSPYAPQWVSPLPGYYSYPEPLLPQYPGAYNQFTVEANTGILRLEVEPRDLLELHVDGYFIGLARDFNSEVMIGPGPHSIELRAEGYEPREVEVDVVPDRLFTIQGSLDVVNEAAAEPGPAARPDNAPRKPTTFYYIPGCYGGNVPPRDADLPPTCDARKVITWTVGR